MDKYLIELKGIHKAFGSNIVLNNINVGFEEGRFVTFLGPSGCGKTTLLRTIAGFYRPDMGEVWIDGKRVDLLPAHKRNTPMVFQEYALFPHLNVFDNVAYGLRLQKLPRKEIETKVREALELTNMVQYKDRNPNQLSGGQQQRVAIARAIVMQSKILLL
ncbi:MAG TPA: ABC transporter ATP-binding protein, partial [Bacillota bacterium]|nr:ABC transporter ATP-binding protein [Bacillota bacterium]